ncbi:MAG: hypothetical protein U9N11_00310 [Campylobacterota bacterium]|nr:hypothetical protein [Campylobacterota bacterium]
MKKISLLALVTFLLANCGGGGSSSSSKDDGFKIQEVKYTLNGTTHPTCHNSSRDTGLESSSTIMNCIWICGRYEGGSEPVSVVLTFSREDEHSVWQYSSDFVSTASPSCHN